MRHVGIYVLHPVRATFVLHFERFRFGRLRENAPESYYIVLQDIAERISMNYGKRSQPATVTFAMRITQKQRDYLEELAAESDITYSEVVKRLIDEDMGRRKMGVSTKTPRRNY